MRRGPKLSLRKKYGTVKAAITASGFHIIASPTGVNIRCDSGDNIAVMITVRVSPTAAGQSAAGMAAIV